MSARDLVLPERALAAMLSRLVDGVTKAEKSTRWPGSVRFAERTSSLVLTGSMQEAVGIDLDRGSWLLYSGIVATTTGGAGARAFYARLDSTSMVGTSQILDVNSQDSTLAPTKRFQLADAERVSLNSQVVGLGMTVTFAFLVALYV